MAVNKAVYKTFWRAIAASAIVVKMMNVVYTLPTGRLWGYDEIIGLTYWFVTLRLTRGWRAKMKTRRDAR